jgi:hypothetical protein
MRNPILAAAMMRAMKMIVATAMPILNPIAKRRREAPSKASTTAAMTAAITWRKRKGQVPIQRTRLRYVSRWVWWLLCPAFIC